MDDRGAHVHSCHLWTFGECAYVTFDLKTLARSCTALPIHALPVHVRKVPKKGVSPETSSPNRDIGGRILRRVMLKMSVSPETSSKNGDVENAGLIFGASKMAVSPETSSKKLDAGKAALSPPCHFFEDVSSETPEPLLREVPLINS